MRYFLDEPVTGVRAKYVAALPLIYLIVALLYSAASAPWGRQVDPESAYAMNGLAWAAGYGMIKDDHPGTTTILLVGLIVKLWAFLGDRSDIVAFGLKNYDSIIYAARAAEALILSGVLLCSGIIVRNATRSVIAAMLFQVAPFVHFQTLHFAVILIPESLMVSCAIFGLALVLKTALNEQPPTASLGSALGMVFALGLSSKYLYAPFVFFCATLLRNWRACAASMLVGAFSFFLFNRVFSPNVFTGGFHWLLALATHKGVYGQGEPGVIDFNVFWPNMAAIISAAPIVSAVFVIGAMVALARILSSRSYMDPVSLALLAAFLVFAAQLVATSKHFALHYMLASWVLTGGVLVLTIIETQRLWPTVSPRLLIGAAGLICVVLISTTLVDIRTQAGEWVALNRIGARLSKAVVAAGPACANVSSMFVRAPENEFNHGADMTLATPQMVDRFSVAYARTFSAPLLDQDVYTNELTRNFRPLTYAQLAAEYPCIVVRASRELDAKAASGLLALKPEHCMIEDVHVYTVGISCEKIRKVAEE